MNMNEIKSKMEKSVVTLKSDLSKLRTGRASTALVENIKVDYYGSPTPLSQVGQISIPDPRTIQITCWDQTAIPGVEKAINAANIGLTPNVDGKIVRLNVPTLTEDRRKDIAKQVKKLGEDFKVMIRNIRREANDSIKVEEKNKVLTEDAAKKAQDDVQKMTDQFCVEVDKIVEAKTKDIMTV